MMTEINEIHPTDGASNSFRLNGYHVAAMFVAFFLVIIVVNFTMAWFASSSWTGLVVRNSYVASQKYNQKIDDARNQLAMGWLTEFAYSKDTISLSVKDKNDQAIFFDKLTMVLGTPVSEHLDRTIVLNRKNSGLYETSIELTQGVWSYALIGEGKTPYRFEGRFHVDGKGVAIVQ